MREPLVKIKTQLNDLQGEMKRLGAEDVNVTPVPAQPREKIEALEKEYKFTLPGPLKDYYLEINGHSISWSLPGSDIAGSSSVMVLDSFFTNRTIALRDGEFSAGTPYYSMYLDEDQQRALDEEYFLFERVFIDSFVLVSRNESGEDAALYLLEHPFILTRLELTFEEYITKLFENRALLNWQQQYKRGGGDEALVSKFNADLKALLPRDAAGPQARGAAGAPYRERLTELVDRLRSNRNLSEVLFERRAEPPPLNVIRKIEKTFGSELPAEMVRFYREVNGFKLAWDTAPGAAVSTLGMLDLPPLEEAFGGPLYKLSADWNDYVTYEELWNTELRESYPEDFHALHNKRIFDRHLVRNQILMEPSGGGVKFFYYIDRGVTELQVEFEELLETLFDTAGVEYYPDLLRPPGEADDDFLDELVESVKIVNPNFSRRRG